MVKNMSQGIKRVKEAIQKLGFEFEIRELPASTRTAPEAAQAIGCEVGQIAKSIVFQSESGQAILVIASGQNRINEAIISQILGEKIIKADADFVYRETGLAIGGVAPVGHLKPLKTFIDQDLSKFRQIWTAAGTPHAVFPLSFAELVKLTQGQVVKIC